MGSATTDANTGVTATGTSGSAELVVAEGDCAVLCGLSLDDVHELTDRARTPTMAATVRVVVGMRRSYGSRLDSTSGAASGSMSFSVRNTKKNTTQPIAEMKIQLTSR
jgi:hypothetical protein